MTAVARVLVVAPEPLQRALLSRLAGGGAEVSTNVQDRAEAVVFAPRGPGPAPESQRDALQAAAGIAQRSPAHVVAVSSAEVYGASPYSPGLVDETWEPPSTHSNEVAAWWRQFEDGIRRLFPASALTILRPAPILDGSSYISRLLRARIAVTLAGHDPSVQLLAIEDLCEAIARALTAGPGGTFNVAPAGVIPVRAALRLASRRRLPLPRLWQRAARRLLNGAADAWPADQVDYIRYAATISGDRFARERGFVASRSSARAVAEFVNAAPPPAGFDERFDPFGQDKQYIDTYGRTLFTLLSRYYWRIETDGIEALPASGPGVLAGPHRGFMPFDGVMLLHLAVRDRRRYPRFLIHPSLVKFPFLFDFMTRLGGIPACRENADWILRQGEIAGVFPEGIHGAFTSYRDAYRLGKFGRDEFVKIALRGRAPILPFATVGSAEIFPILAKVRWPWWERLTEWPCFPITPTFPVAPVPLPSKWHVRFLPALHVEQMYPAEAADDPRVVRSISAEVRARIQTAMDDMLARRRWIFFGSIFDRGADGTV